MTRSRKYYILQVADTRNDVHKYRITLMFLDKNKQYSESEIEELREQWFSRSKVEVWPGCQIPIPDVEVLDAKLDKDDFITFVFQGYPGNTDKAFKKPPEELYLREIFDLDITCTEDILAFTKKYGRLGEDYWASLPNRFGDRTKYNEFQLNLSRLRDEFIKSKAEDFYPDGRPVCAFDECAHITEISAHVTLLRDMVRIWDFYKGGISFSSMCRLWGNPIIGPPVNKQEALSILEDVLNKGLNRINIRVQVTPKYDSEDKSRFRGLGYTLYSALCLQFANHIAADARYSRCKNETCDHRFVHQRGRAQFGQHRSRGVDYCSKKCATAQAVRNHRERKKSD